MRILGLILTLALSWSSPLWADDSPKDIYCSDYHDYQVFWIKNRTLDKIATAGRTEKGVPIIRYNPEQLPDLSRHTRRFAYNYECARHVLGYTLDTMRQFAGQKDQVSKADCWAVSRLRYEDRLSLADIKAIETEINQLTREQWTHFTGPVRAVDFKKTCPLKQ